MPHHEPSPSSHRIAPWSAGEPPREGCAWRLYSSPEGAGGRRIDSGPRGRTARQAPAREAAWPL
ncbi:hypothetical protein D187_004182 [Cystobacter fuscus DSM 2262]|uniref:Uncharacterized protein n=1 Tax=Cystobacter fuscus (strain ATCC 25194 / DSM 2262 / NBRC 100088 / M29) TaxID=1242864 RepID=S9P135_CYSF2|nr:hypothetical protein D187_004182 [Cystobacter fuscus DSM 2262]